MTPPRGTNGTCQEVEIDSITDELMARAREIGEEIRGGIPTSYPPGVDPEKLAALMREGLRDAIADQIRRSERP